MSKLDVPSAVEAPDEATERVDSPPASTQLCRRCGDLGEPARPWIPEFGWCEPCVDRFEPVSDLLVPPVRAVAMQLMGLFGIWTFGTLAGLFIGLALAFGLSISSSDRAMVLVTFGLLGFSGGTFLLPFFLHRRLNRWGYQIWLDTAIKRIGLDPQVARAADATMVRWRSDLRGYGWILRPDNITLMLRSPGSMTLVSAHSSPLRITRERLVRLRPFRAPFRELCNGVELGLDDGRICSVLFTHARSLAEADRLVSELIEGFPVTTEPVSVWSRTTRRPPPVPLAPLEA